MTTLTMAGSSPRRNAPRAGPWPQELHRAATFLAASSVFYWMAFAFSGWTVWIAGVGIIYMDLILAWVAVLLAAGAWPDLWDGLRDLLTVHPAHEDALVARRSFFLALALVLAAVLLLPLQYHVVPALESWFLVLYVTTFPYLAWTFVPTLALHGILFGRVADFLSPSARHVSDFGAAILFAVAAATTLLILADPGSSIFLRAWSVGAGILPAAACAGYVLIATGLTWRDAPAPKPVPTRGWAAAKTPRGGPERFA